MSDKVAMGSAAAGERLRELVGRAVGRRITKAVRDELRALAEPVRAGAVQAGIAVEDTVVKRGHSGHEPLWELDFDLVDAALDAGVPVADTPPGVVFGLASWAGRARRGDLAAVAADPRFRALVSEAVFHRRGDLLSLGRPETAWRDEPGFTDAVLGAAGLVDIVYAEVTAWDEAVSDGSLPAAHEAVQFLDLIGPARFVAACPAARDAVHRLLAADVPELLAATWRAGLLDELGLDALDAMTVYSHSLEALRMEPVDGGPEDTFLVTDGNRSQVYGPQGLVTGPVFVRLPADRGVGSASPRFRFEQGRFTAVPHDSAVGAPSVTMPGAATPNVVGRAAGHWWEMSDAGGAVVGRWYQGPARPPRVSGAHSVGRRRHRWASGSEIVPPPQVWGYMSARDEKGSGVLRSADRALAARVLDAVPVELADQVTELGRRIPVGNPSREMDEAFASVRDVVAALLPGVTAERLLDGIAGTVWSAVECHVLTARHLDRGNGVGPAAVLRTAPLPHPRADAGDLRARIFTEMQDMYLRLGRVAEACADPRNPSPPQTVRLANARGWEADIGRLGGRALRAALHGHGAGPVPERSNELRADHIRAWGVPHMGEPAGRWRTLSLQLDVSDGPREGTVCRTARGCLIVMQGSATRSVAAIEYAPDGVFGPAPFGTITAQHVCRGWGGTDNIAAWLRLLDERGPMPWPTASIRSLAEATGMTVERATLLAIGFDARDAANVQRGAVGTAPALIAASGLDETRVKDEARLFAAEADVQDRLMVPELLMPDDVSDLWSDRLAVQRAAEWWNGRAAAKGRGV